MESDYGLFKNTLYFGIANIGSRLIYVILTPLYAYALTAEEYGLSDLIQSTVLFCMPLFTIQISSSVMRFAMDKNYERGSIFRTAIKILFLSTVLVGGLTGGIVTFMNLSPYYFFLPILYFFSAAQEIFSQFCKANDKVFLFAIEGILSASTLLVFNALFLLVFKMGVLGYMLAIVISNIISLVFLTIGGKLVKYYKIGKKDRALTYEMIRYSLPLVPSKISWWIMSLSDRYIIGAICGVAMSGMYAIAYKIPGILDVFVNIFIQAWQISIIKRYENKDENSSVYCSDIFHKYTALIFIAAACLIIFIKPLAKILFTSSFFEAWKYVPLLIVAILFSSIQNFFGSIYTAAKASSKVFYSTLVGALINLILNFCLIPIWNVYGAIISTCISYMIVAFYRMIDSRRYIIVNVSYMKISYSTLLLIAQAINISAEYPYKYFIHFVLFTLLILTYRTEIKTVIKATLDFLERHCPLLKRHNKVDIRRGIMKKSNQYAILQPNTEDEIKEAYKMVMMNIQHLLVEELGKKIVICSANPQEGKTTTCMNLAITFAEAGKKVIIIDGNFRESMLSTLFNQDTSVGLSNLLNNEVALQDVIKATSYPNLNFISTGYIPSNTLELLNSHELNQVLRTLSYQYMYIFIDTPALDYAVDGVIWATKASGVIIVGKQNQTSYQSIEEVVEKLQKVDTKILGTIINEVDVPSHKNFSFSRASKNIKIGSEEE